MLKKHKKEVIQAFIIVFLLFIVTGLAIYTYNGYFTEKKDVIVKFSTDEVVEIQNILPVSDKLGKTLENEGIEDGVQGFVEFLIYNPNKYDVNYQIYLTKSEKVENEIKEDYIKVYLTDNKNKPFPTYDSNATLVYSDLNYLTDKPDAKLVYSGMLSGKATKKYRLRVWLSDSYFFNTNLETFKCRVHVRVK